MWTVKFTQKCQIFIKRIYSLSLKYRHLLLRCKAFHLFNEQITTGIFDVKKKIKPSNVDNI